MSRIFLIAFVCILAACNSSKRSTSPVTDAEASEAIRQVLDRGVDQGISTFAHLDGYNGNSNYRFDLPVEAQVIESSLRTIGMGSLVDKAVTQINRAAEDAVNAVRPMMKEDIRKMTITNPMAIVNGPSDSATNYFRQRFAGDMVDAYMPIVRSSLEKMNALKLYTDMLNAYNGFPTTKNKLNPDLARYVARHTFDSFFDQMAREEANIRNNRSARNTEALRRVFGR